MNNTAISVRNMSKKYQLYKSPKHRLKEALHPFRRKYHHEFWALKDVSFEVRQGETVGIIGRNGSGKSTLLQIISGTMTPTNGEVKINGRVSALLELGAGFNPEFTGRDNVYLNGSIMGMSRDAMNECFEDIASFADIGDFIDQPVKIYSSGMYVRLAFACAINVAPDILIIDEALSVGDAKFQHKCYLKFRELQEQDITILLVSHDLEAIVKHCDHTLLVDSGQVIVSGLPKDVTIAYRELLATGSIDNKINDIETSTNNNNGSSSSVLRNKTELEKLLDFSSSLGNCSKRKNYNPKEKRIGNRQCEIIDYLVCQGDHIDPTSVFAHEVIDIYLKIKSNAKVDRPYFGNAIKTIDGIMVFGSNSKIDKLKLCPIKENEIAVFHFSIKMDLASGDYFITLGIGALDNNDNYIFMDSRQGMVHLQVVQNKPFDGLVRLETGFQEIHSCK